jgi:hypothetical protein
MLKPILVVLSLTVSLCAAPIQNTFTGVGTGSIGQTAFTDTAFTIVATAQTGDIQNFGHVFAVNHLTASINIVGLGTFDFLIPTRTFVNNNSQAVGFSHAQPIMLDLYNFNNVAGADIWDMQTSISHSGLSSVLQWDDSPVNTSGGVLIFSSNSPGGSFTSTVGGEIPEPSSALLLSSAGLIVFYLRRR